MKRYAPMKVLNAWYSSIILPLNNRRRRRRIVVVVIVMLYFSSYADITLPSLLVLRDR